MTKKIITDINFLRQKSQDIMPDEIPEILKDLEDTLTANKNGIGLAGVQIGILKNIAIVRIGDIKINLINPIILEKSEKIRVNGEGCLSMPGLYVDTFRYNKITIENNGIIARYEDIQAIAIIHEYYHMQGKLIIDFKWHGK